MKDRKEARECKQSYYGGYVEMCIKLGIGIVPFHSFTIDEHDEVKKLIRRNIKFKL